MQNKKLPHGNAKLTKVPPSQSKNPLRGQTSLRTIGNSMFTHGENNKEMGYWQWEENQKEWGQEKCPRQ